MSETLGAIAEASGAAPPRYRAFISYSHTDAEFAAGLHRRLERWRLADGTRLAPVFIDRAELAAGPDLSAQVRSALAQSAALIVIASPAARASHWVGQEIDLFRELCPGRPVLAALLTGEPAEAFPQALLHHRSLALEPLAADFRAGRDGQRLGLLKLIAGLTQLPLDQIIQRDAQTRQRRVMAVTAAALLLSLILAALLVAALRARTEAEHQRAEAEGMVEFMLTDLRDKLKGVGRLDIMDAVNERAMAHYTSEFDLAGLPDDQLQRRAKLLQAMAEDDLSAVGHFPRAAAEAKSAALLTSELIRRTPDGADAMMAHAKSEYWLGQAEFVAEQRPGNQRRVAAEPHWQEYRRLTAALAARTPVNPDWLVEASYADGNLCAVNLSAPARPHLALKHCQAATQALAAAYRIAPNDLDIGLNLATAYAWQADANAAAGNNAEAVADRARQSALVEQMAQQFPGDLRMAEARLLASFGLAKLALKMHRTQTAHTQLQQALLRARELRLHDPGNADWASWLDQISKLQQSISHQGTPQ